MTARRWSRRPRPRATGIARRQRRPTPRLQRHHPRDQAEGDDAVSARPNGQVRPRLNWGISFFLSPFRPAVAGVSYGQFGPRAFSGTSAADKSRSF